MPMTPQQHRARLNAADDWVDKGNPLQGLSVALRGYQIASRELGMDHPVTSEYRFTITDLTVKSGRVHEAIIRAKTSIEEAKRRFGDRSKEVALEYIDLGHLHFGQNDEREARDVLEKGIYIMEMNGLHQHPHLGFGYFIMGAALIRDRDEDDAQGYLDKAHPILSRYMETHGQYAMASTWLRTRHALKVDDLDRAEGLIHTGLAMNQPLRGQEPFIDQELFSHMGEVMWRKGHIEQAVALYLRSYDLTINARRPQGLGDLQRAVQVLRVTGDLDKAISLLRGALKRSPDWVDDPDGLALDWNRELMHCCQERGDLKGAEKAAKTALAITKRAKGKEGVEYGSALIDLGWVVLRSGKREKGMDLIEKGKGIIDSRTRFEQVYELHQYFGYMQVLAEEAGDHPKAWQLIKDRLMNRYIHDVLDRSRTELEVFNIRREMGMLIFRWKGNDPIGIRYAENILRETLASQREFFTQGHVQDALVVVDLSEVLHARGQLTAAWNVLSKAMPVLERDLKPGHPMLARAAALQERMSA